jgi:hypothetical protein
MKITILCFLVAFLPTYSQSKTETYVPDDQQLYETIVKQDSVFFDAYNHCETKLQLYSDYYAENLEFYHDKGGLMTSKADVILGTQKNICRKVTRHLKKGSIEVYPIKNYGAIEMGLHQFHNKAEPNAIPHDSKFIIFWRLADNKWKIEKVVSLH